MATGGEADPVGLKAVAEAGLGRAAASLQFDRQPLEIGVEIGVETSDEGGHDTPEEDPPKPGAGLTGSVRSPRATRRVGAIGRE